MTAIDGLGCGGTKIADLNWFNFFAQNDGNNPKSKAIALQRLMLKIARGVSAAFSLFHEVGR